MLVRLTSSGSEEATTQELTGLQFYNQRKSGEGEKNKCFGVDILPSSVSPAG